MGPIGSARAFVLAAGTALIAGYLALAPFVPDFITCGILDGARNVAEGRGLVTNYVTPAFLPYYQDLTWPLAYLWYPLLPAVTGGLFVVFGERDWLVLVLPVATYLLSGLLLFELGRQVFSTTTGILAALVLLTHPFMIETAARENFTDPTLVCLVVGAVLALLASASRPFGRALPWIVLAGVLLGVSQYARWAAAMLYLPMTVLAVASAPSSRRLRAAVFLGSCLAAQVPLFLWNMTHVGSLTFSPAYVFLFLTASLPSLAAFSVLLPTTVREVAALYGHEIAAKWLSQVWVHYKFFFTAASPMLLASALLSFTRPFDGPQRALRRFTLVLYVVLVAANSLVYWDDRYLLPVMPFAALLGVEFLRQSVLDGTSIGLRRTVVAAAIALLVLSPGVDFFFQTWKSRAQFPRLQAANAEWAGFLNTHLRTDDIVMAVEAPQVSWQTRRSSVGLPRDPQTALRIRKEYVPFNTLILDPAPPAVDLFHYSAEWYRIASGEATLPGFAIEQRATLPSGRVVVLLRASAARE